MAEATLELVILYGGRESNSYVTLEEANTHMLTKLNATEGTRASDTERMQVLIQGARDIDREIWEGRQYYYYQFLQFPRVSEEYDWPYGYSENYGLVDYQRSDPLSSPIPEFDEYLRKQKLRVQAAQADQALYVLRNAGRRAHREDQFEGAASVSRGVSGYSESFSYRAPSFVLCPEAADHLVYYHGGPEIVRV